VADQGLDGDALRPALTRASRATAFGSNIPAVLASYFLGITLAEVIITFYPLPTGAYVGIVFHMGIVAALLGQASATRTTNEALSRFLLALTPVPMVRVFSLSLPLTGLEIIPALAIISVPLLATPFAVMHALGIRLRAVGLTLGSRRNMALQGGLALTGLPLGAVEFFILRPSPAWLPSLTLLSLLLGALVVIIASGLTEELIFRGILMGEGERVVGGSVSLLYVTLLFMAMHIGFASVVDLIFVFLVGLYFGMIVQRTKNLVGVTLAHGFGNVVLYLIMPFYF
jgi:hypothetical protein